MRYSEALYREAFPEVKIPDQPKVSTPVETFTPDDPKDDIQDLKADEQSEAIEDQEDIGEEVNDGNVRDS